MSAAATTRITNRWSSSRCRSSSVACQFLLGGAGRRIAARGIGLLLKVHRGLVFLIEIGRIFERDGKDQELLAAWVFDQIEVFRHHAICAIGDAVLAQVSRL